MEQSHFSSLSLFPFTKPAAPSPAAGFFVFRREQVVGPIREWAVALHGTFRFAVYSFGLVMGMPGSHAGE